MGLERMRTTGTHSWSKPQSVRRLLSPSHMNKGVLKKATSSVLAILPCSRTESTLRAPKRLRPCWMDFFDHPLGCCRQRLLEHV